MRNLIQYKNKKIPGEKIYLKQIARNNLKATTEWLGDPEINKYLNNNIKNITYRDELAWYNSIRKSDTEIVFAIYTRHENRYIGNCGLHKIDYKNNLCEMGIFIGDRNYLDKGYGTDSINTLINFAISALEVKKIRLVVYEYNNRAISVYKNCGFVTISVFEKYHFYNDAYWDAYLMEYSF
jgi:RimJ/RimL family protein N-acetyltransferase